MKQHLFLFLCIPFIFSACSMISSPDNDHSTMDHSMHEMGSANDMQSAEDIETLPLVKSTQIVELQAGDTFELTASKVQKTINGKQVAMLAYNQQIPGPLIKVEKDAKVTVKFTNTIGEDTTLHSHGLRLDNAFDGVPDVTQPPVKTGESFTYELTFPDSGVYWYHPHMREDKQQELGMYGNFYVQPKATEYWSEVNREEFLFLDDILLDADGDIASFSDTAISHTLMGRYGNTYLLNGETDYKFSAKKGEVIRFFLTNSANTRTFNISLENDIQMKVVGADASKYEEEFFAESVILSPSERVVLEAFIPADFVGDSIDILHTSGEIEVNIGSILLDGVTDTSYEESFDVLRTNQETIDDIATFKQYFDKNVDHNIKLDVSMKIGDMEGMDHSGHDMNHEATKIEWEDGMPMMNQMSSDENIVWQIIDEDTGKINGDISWKHQQGDVVKIKIFNDPNSDHPMQHPFHIHGQRFLVLSSNGTQNENLAWKDTTLIQTGDMVELLVDMSNPGKWMMHCHIAEHLHSGMMAHFIVE